MVAEDLESTGVAAFSNDSEGRVVEWNAAAQRLLGYERREVIGRPCHEIIQGTDLSGNRYCSKWCIPRDMARAEKCIRSYPMDARTRSDESIRVVCSILVIHGPRSSGYRLVHVLHVVPPAAEGCGDGASCAAAGARQPEGLVAGASGERLVLTSRELEVLRLLSAGAATRVIADSLFISPATVRTHVQAILRKLGAHSKLEAVSIATRLRLIRMP